MPSLSSTSELLTVSELTDAIKSNLETRFAYVYLQGEISNFKTQSSGHLYFSLKDDFATISVVMFKGSAVTLKTMPKAGDHVIVKGEINVYPPKGNYQLIVRELTYVGIGELLQKLEQLKIKLHQMGWFKAIHKKPLPRFPHRIGVVTSPTGAVIQDILHILSRRYSDFHLILNPVKVQGEGAAEEIAQAIKQFNDYQLVDVMIVGRGGGSLEDLWAFNTEQVATAIFHSQIPIISAVGHETDHCIADYVADVRAPTPSAAAEIVVSEKKQQLAYLTTARSRMQQTLFHLIQTNRYRLQGLLTNSHFAHPMNLVDLRVQQLDDYRAEIQKAYSQFFSLKKSRLEGFSRHLIAFNPKNRLLFFQDRLCKMNQNLINSVNRLHYQYKQRLLSFSINLDQNWFQAQKARKHHFHLEKLKFILEDRVKNHIRRMKQQLVYYKDMMQALDPKNVLQKGYSILFAEKKASVVNSVKKLRPGQTARLLLADGEVLITINEVIPCDFSSS